VLLGKTPLPPPVVLPPPLPVVPPPLLLVPPVFPDDV
jgi:hypothetical protein